MSSEAPDCTVTPHKRDDPAPYWAFFMKEASAFWHFVDRSPEDLTSQASAPQPAEPSHQRSARGREG